MHIQYWIELFQCDRIIKDISESYPEFAHYLELLGVWHPSPVATPVLMADWLVDFRPFEQCRES